MGSIGPLQILLVLVLLVLLFGRGKISELMGDVAKGITNFRKGLAEGQSEKSDPSTGDDAKVIDNDTGEPVNMSETKDKAET